MDSSHLVVSVGLVIVAAVSMSGVVAVVRSVLGFRDERRRHALALEAFRERIRAARTRTAEKVGAELGWRGFRKFEVVRKAIEAEGVVSVYLAPCDRKPLAAHEPGHYLTFRLAIPGVPRPVTRCYSLSEALDGQQYRVTVKRVGLASGEGGLVSSFFNERLARGDVLEVGAPRGDFVLDVARQRPLVFVGGGIGVTPLFCMLTALVRARSRREVWFFLGVRHKGQHVFREALQKIAAENKNVRLHVAYSAPRPEDVLGTDYDSAGHVSVALLRSLLPSNDHEFYVCGPPALMRTVTSDLAGWGVPAGSVHTEAFGAASVPKTAPSESPEKPRDTGRQVTVTFSRSAKTLTCGTGSNLLELAEANGIAIDSGCRAGRCNTCLTPIAAGEVSYEKTVGLEPEGGCLVCVCTPASDLVLEA